MGAHPDAKSTLALDRTAVTNLPAWARTDGGSEPRLVLAEQGLALVAAGRGTAVPWEHVLGVAVAAPAPNGAPRAYVLVPREPPRPPWLEIAETALPEGMDVRTLADRIRARTEHRGYRHAAPGAPSLPAEQLRERIVARDAVRGALEIPLVSGKGPPAWTRALLSVLSFGVGSYLGLWGGLVLAGLLSAVGPRPVAPALIWIVALATGLAGAALGLSYGHERRKHPRRVLALTPDGCVCGFPHGIRAFGWDEIDRFELVRAAPDAPAAQLAVLHRDGGVCGTIETRWLDAAPEVVVAVANEYRRRHRPA